MLASDKRSSLFSRLGTEEGKGFRTLLGRAAHHRVRPLEREQPDASWRKVRA
jgi:hypothetical protein